MLRGHLLSSKKDKYILSLNKAIELVKPHHLDFRGQNWQDQVPEQKSLYEFLRIQEVAIGMLS